MINNSLARQQISKDLSQISKIWFLNEKHTDLNNFITLYNFVKELELSESNSKNKPQQIPYNNSIMHFLLYYCSYPKYPFIVNIEDTLIFGSFSGRNYNNLELSFPLFIKANSALENLNSFLSNPFLNSLLKKNNVKSILLRDINDDFVRIFRSNEQFFNFKIESLKELNYALYKVNKTLDLSGPKYANLRWHLNSFKKQNYKIEFLSIIDEVKPVIHLIGKWRSQAMKNRGFSFTDVSSDKKAARLVGEIKKYASYNKEIIGPSQIITRVLKVNGVVASFNLGYPLGIFKRQDVFAHAIGISDISIPHLAEYSQYDFWIQVKKAGYEYINDGPTWRHDLEIYKDKYRPISKTRYYWATLNKVI